MNEMLRNFILLDLMALSPDEQQRRADEFFELLNRRRTVRDFSDRNVPLEFIEKAIATAGTEPSGANMQPWHITSEVTLACQWC